MLPPAKTVWDAWENALQYGIKLHQTKTNLIQSLNIQNISICSYNISNNNHIHCNMTTVLQETKESFVSQSKS